MIIGLLSGLILIAILGVILLKNRLAKGIMIAIGIILILIAGGLYFLGALAPPKVTITANYISTNTDFINGVTIEKLMVDSIGDKKHPVKYTVIYATSCNINHPTNKPPEPPNMIEFNKPGKYSWDEDTTRVRYIHKGLSRQSIDKSNELRWQNKFGDHPVCPIKFEKEQWYFITFSDARVTGIFFYIDKYGKENQFYLTSGVSPI